jgi:hypothetical protein
MTMTEAHVHHLARRNDSLQQKIAKLQGKAAKVVSHSVGTLEVAAGAALGGVLQGMSKKEGGARIFHVPADLAIGLGLNIAGHLDLAGREWSGHLGNVGNGFVAAYFTEAGYAIGKRKRETGHFFQKKGTAALPAPAAAQGEVSPQAMAEALLHQMQARQAA